MSVRFTAPVARELAAQLRLRPASGERARAGVRQGRQGHRGQRGRVPEAARRERRLQRRAAGRDLKDNAGRPLANASAFPLKVQTGSAPPIAKFAAAPFGIVERNARGDAAGDAAPRAGRPAPGRRRRGERAARVGGRSGQVRVKRLQSDADILAWYARLQKYHETQMTATRARPARARVVHLRGRDATPRAASSSGASSAASARARSRCSPRSRGARRLDLPQLAGGDPRPFEVVGIPLAEPGYHVVEIESLRLGESLLDKRAPMYVRTGVLVTNLGVHFKLGRENSVVWVTTLDAASRSRAPTSSSRLQRQAALERHAPTPRAWPSSPRALDAELRALRRRQRLLRQRAQGRRRTAARPTWPSSSAAGRRASSPGASTCRPGAAPSPTCAPHGVRPHAAARRRDGVDEALRARRDARRPRAGARRPLPTRRQDRPPGQRPGVHPAAARGAAAAAAR